MVYCSLGFAFGRLCASFLYIIAIIIIVVPRSSSLSLLCKSVREVCSL